MAPSDLVDELPISARQKNSDRLHSGARKIDYDPPVSDTSLQSLEFHDSV